MIKAICFDLDGVYFTSDGFKSFKRKIEDLGVSKEKIDFILHGDPMTQFKKGLLSEEAFWAQAVSHWGISKTFSDLKYMLGEGYEINPQVDALVEKVRKNGYKACICSNNFKTRIEVLDLKFDFLKNFDFYIFSYQVGIMKPDKGIYEDLLRQGSLQANELIYSDDSQDKLQGALELGINAFVYENFNQFVGKLVSLGVKI